MITAHPSQTALSASAQVPPSLGLAPAGIGKPAPTLHAMADGIGPPRDDFMDFTAVFDGLATKAQQAATPLPMLSSQPIAGKKDPPIAEQPPPSPPTDLIRPETAPQGQAAAELPIPNLPQRSIPPPEDLKMNALPQAALPSDSEFHKNVSNIAEITESTSNLQAANPLQLPAEGVTLPQAVAHPHHDAGRTIISASVPAAGSGDGISEAMTAITPGPWVTTEGGHLLTEGIRTRADPVADIPFSQGLAQAGEVRGPAAVQDGPSSSVQPDLLPRSDGQQPLPVLPSPGPAAFPHGIPHHSAHGVALSDPNHPAQKVAPSQAALLHPLPIPIDRGAAPPPAPTQGVPAVPKTAWRQESENFPPPVSPRVAGPTNPDPAVASNAQIAEARVAAGVIDLALPAASIASDGTETDLSSTFPVPRITRQGRPAEQPQSSPSAPATSAAPVHTFLAEGLRRTPAPAPTDNAPVPAVIPMPDLAESVENSTAQPAPKVPSTESASHDGAPSIRPTVAPMIAIGAVLSTTVVVLKKAESPDSVPVDTASDLALPERALPDRPQQKLPLLAPMALPATGEPFVESSTHPSKLPETAPAALTQPPTRMADLVSHHILPHIGAAGSVSVTLAPVELGILRFEITPRGDSLHLHLSVDQPATLDLLRRQGDQMLAELRQAGFANASLSFASSDGQNGANPGNSDQQGHRPQTITQPVPSPDSAPPIAPSRPAPPGTLDLRL